MTQYVAEYQKARWGYYVRFHSKHPPAPPGQAPPIPTSSNAVWKMTKKSALRYGTKGMARINREKKWSENINDLGGSHDS